MRIKQYLTNTDYGLWQVIMNGDEHVQTTRDENGVETKVPPKTAQAVLARQRERKAKSIMLLAILDEYQLRFQKLIILLEAHGATVSNEDANQKFLRALPSSWNNLALIMRNKEGIDELDIVDLYNNLKVFEADIKGSSGSSSNSQNVAFLSAEDTNSINEVNTANGVSTVAGHSSSRQASSSSYTDDLMFLFFASQSNSPQLDDEDLKQIDHDDLEEIDLKWQVVMLSIRVKRFYKKTERKLNFNSKEPIGFNKTKVECFNFYRQDHFTRECRASIIQGNRNRYARYRNMDNNKRVVPVESSDALVIQDNALIVQDGLGYDWSYIAQEEPTEFALMAYTSGSDTEKGKQHKVSCKVKLVSSISQPLQMLHMDLFGPTFVRSISHKTYCLVVTDDFSRFSWVFFLATKSETSGILKKFITEIENQLNKKVKVIRSDNGTEFKNREMDEFCGQNRIIREYSVARTPQQNRVAERKNRTLIEAVRTMIADSLLPTIFWAEAEKVSTQQYIVFPLWSSISSSYKSSDDMAGDNTADDAIENGATEQSDDVKKEFQAQCNSQLLQENVTRSSSTNSITTISTPVNTASASRTFIPPHDPIIPELEDTAEIQTTEFLEKVYKVEKAFYGLHQAPRAWYETLSTYLLDNGFHKGQIDKNLFIKRLKGLQVQQKEDGIFINQDKYVGEILKKFGFFSIRSASTPMETHKPLTKDENVTMRVPAWTENPQQDVVNFSMMDYGYNLMQTKIHVDNESVICVIKNPVYHSKTKHIEIRHHFIRDSYEKKLIEMVKIYTDTNVVDLLTKAFDVSDEAVHKELGDIMERAAITTSSLEAEQDSEQFWKTAALSTIEDGVMAITATIDRNVKVLITEASIRRHLKLGDSEGLSTLPTEEIFQQRALMGPNKTAWEQFSSNIATTIICLQKKKAYSFALTQLILRVKKLERTVKTSKARRKARIVISKDGDAEDPSKQERSLIEELDMDVDIPLVPPQAADQGRKSDDTQVSGQPKDQLGVFSAAKVLADVVEQGRSARDKGKAVMQESEPTKKIKKRIQVQMSIDEELARKLHEEELARPRSVAEVRKSMCIYLKNQGGFKKFKDQKEQFKKLRDNLLKKKRERKVMTVASQQERKHFQESVKKQKLEDDTEKKELKAYFYIVPEDEFVMKVKSLETKYPIIDWKTHYLTGHFMYYQFIKADGSSKNYKIFSEMLNDFDRQDVMDLHRLVEERYTTTSPEAIHMLIEKKYPLGQEMISKMLNKRLVEQESEMAFELLRNNNLITSTPTPTYPIQVALAAIQETLANIQAEVRTHTTKIANLKRGEGMSQPRTDELTGQPRTRPEPNSLYGKLIKIEFLKFSGALVWYQQYVKKYPDNTPWEHFKVEVVKRFGVLYDDPIVELKNLKQTGSVQTYQEAFEALLNRVDLHKLVAVSMFIGGLKPEVKTLMIMFQATTLSETYRLTRMQEATNTTLKPRYNTLLLPTPKQSTTTYTSKVVTTPVKSNSVGKSSGYVTRNGASTLPKGCHLRYGKGIDGFRGDQVKDKFPIPMIEEIIDELNGSVVFFKLDLRHFKIKTDHFSFKYLLNQKPTTLFQFKWMPKLLRYEYEIVYNKGSENVVVDALSRMDSSRELLQIYVSSGSSGVWDKGNKYSWTGKILKRKRKVVVGNDPKLRKELVQHFHDEAIGGHYSAHVTMKKLASLFY
nr:putative ribonuclease H-like domain-containing protein [Tanacetum cinerariifolium]